MEIPHPDELTETFVSISIALGILTFVAIVAVALRLIHGKRTMALWWDDWTIVGASCLCCRSLHQYCRRYITSIWSVWVSRCAIHRSAVEQLVHKLQDEVEKAPGDGFFFMEIGKYLPAILRGETDPLSLIFRDGLVDRYYEAMLDNDHHAYPAAQIIDLLSFKNPSMRIIEIGAGTGGQTARYWRPWPRTGYRSGNSTIILISHPHPSLLPKRA
ncbi:uncharacterized protein F4812DRAFT_443732 [Daldinia caldariorum]|uniref:uncharacterized protein n=1 Tax=Daldinia caldariorum TaxID=326644 RepID=UPI002007ADA8|nr:uncharacterized protein F4812DRAFT_443732 [Daldinia caldariorum]KAI1464191.1 hypothetical protein F4812DRAFT_443732 [Daldinia caldariorum]